MAAKQFNHWQDPQLNIMSALSLIQFTTQYQHDPAHCELYHNPSRSGSAIYSLSHTRRNRNTNDGVGMGNDKPSGSDALLSILNWIAAFFVREPQGDVVATALSAMPNTLTLYIAMNRGQPEAEDRENAVTFISALREALTKPDPLNAREVLVLAALSVSSARVSRKFEMVSNMPQIPPILSERPSDYTAVRFQEFVKRWSARGGQEGDVITTYFRAVFGEKELETQASAKDALIVAVRQLVLFGHQSISEPPENTYAFCSLARGLCRSEFFKTLPPRAPFPPNDEPFGDLTEEEHTWLMKLKRRLWRLAHYVADADTFIDKGFAHIKKVLGEKYPDTLKNQDTGFNIVWVGDELDMPENHGKLYTWPQTPIERFQDLLETYDIQVDQEKLDDNDFKTAIGGIWGSTIRPFLHCELQLILYLEKHAINVRLIGVSKLMCFACNVWVNVLNQLRPSQQQWVLSGTSGKAHHGWLIPGGEVDDLVQRQIEVELENRILSFAEHKLGGGSDSSAGSWHESDTDTGIGELVLQERQCAV